jgi:GTP-binding protein Era
MAKDSFEGTDITMFIMDAQKDITEDDREVLELLRSRPGKKILVLNKVDVIDKTRLLELSQKLHSMIQFETVFMISALKGNGVEDILRYLSKNLPSGPYLYPEDEITDFPARLLAADITRERLFFNLHDEIPYNTMVETETYKENTREIRIDQSIYVISETHKKMLIGTKGQLIKKIGEESRRQLAKLLGKKVHLFLHVKVRDNWMENKENYNISGLDFFS